MPLLLALLPVASAATLPVCATCDHTTVQSALDAAVDGDVIAIDAGTWSGPLTADVEVSLQASGGAVTLSGDGGTLLAASADITLEGLTLDPGAGGIGLSLAIGVEGTVGACTFEGGAAGIRLAEDAGVTVEDSVFSGDGTGSAVTGTCTAVRLVSSTLERYGDSAVALEGTDCTVEVEGSTFSDNGGTTGGALRLLAAGSVKLALVDAVFEGNDAAEGGAVHLDATDADDLVAVAVDGTTFAENLATGAGGALLLELPDGPLPLALTLLHSTFRENEATEGGAIAVSGWPQHVRYALVEDVTFCANHATADGGAVHASLGGAVPALWLGNRFVENTAGSHGGAAFLDDAAQSFWFQDFLGNDAPEGGAIWSSGRASDVQSSIVYGHPDGYGAWIEDGILNASYGLWADNAPDDLYGDTLLASNQTSDPLLVDWSADGDCTNDDLSPSSASPLVDAADPDFTESDGTRYDVGASAPPVVPTFETDDDGDGYPIYADCDDGSVRSNRREIWYQDADWDGYGSTTAGGTYCTGPRGYVNNDDDCDDTDAEAHPDVRWFVDADGDGFGDSETWIDQCERPEGYVANEDDCDDTDASVGGGTWYEDLDGDGYGNAYGSTQETCTPPGAGWVNDDTDCNDEFDTRNPGATEACNGHDDDCDRWVDEDLPFADWYRDADGDGWGDEAEVDNDCTQPPGHVEVGGDCDDADATIAPDTDEVCDGVDQDCDGLVDEEAVDRLTAWADADGDGFGDAAAPTVACEVPAGHVTRDDDCDDADPAAFPGAVETCDGVDEDCDGTTDEEAVDALLFYADADGDGWGDPGVTLLGCEADPGFVPVAEDCDDGDAAVSPDGVERCDGVDEDCDGTVDEDPLDGTSWYADTDGDGYGDAAITAYACEAPPGFGPDGTDCDDADPGRSPGTEEIPGDGVDQDCTGFDPPADRPVPPSGEKDPERTGVRGGGGLACDAGAAGGGGWAVLMLLGLLRRRQPWLGGRKPI